MDSGNLRLLVVMLTMVRIKVMARTVDFEVVKVTNGYVESAITSAF